jgi:hypothetical protein
MIAPWTTPITREALLHAGWTREAIGYGLELPIVDGGEAIRLLLVEADGDPMVFVAQNLDGEADRSVVQLSCGRFETMQSLERLVTALRGDAGQRGSSSAGNRSLRTGANGAEGCSAEGFFVVEGPGGD